MPRFRSLWLLLLLALVSPARSQDGPRDAAAAQSAGQAFGLYLDGVLKAGGQPDFTKPPASDLFGHIFDVAALEALPPAQAGDLGWLLPWGGAVNQSYARIILFGLKPGQAPDQLVLRRNMAEYEDQCAMAMNFLIRFEARQATALSEFLEQLPPDQRTPTRAAGLQQARMGAAESIVGAITAMMQGMTPVNDRLVTAALRDTRDTWATYLMPADRSKIAAILADPPAMLPDPEARTNLGAFAVALAAAK